MCSAGKAPGRGAADIRGSGGSVDKGTEGPPKRSSNVRLEPWAALDNPFGHCMARESGDIVDSQLVHHLLAMFLDGFDADGEFGGNLLVEPPFGNELKHFRLPAGQVPARFALAFAERLAAMVAQALGYHRAEICVALVGLADRFGQVVDRSLFD